VNVVSNEFSPYAEQLGLRIVEQNTTGLLFELPGQERFVGNPVLSAFHGGVICGAMNCSMLLTVMHLNNLDRQPKLIDQTTSFLGSTSTEQSIFVRTELTKPGKRILGASCRAFQEAESHLVAKSSALFKASDSVGVG
jgi:acyl-coenzyme A thioesterase PaaI-like protein